MPWLILLFAGLLETCWAIGLRYTDGFTRPVPSLLTGSAIVASMYLLAFAVKDIPVGAAYAVWVGIGATGAAIGGMVLLGEAASPARIAFLVLLGVAIVGLKFTSGH